MPIRRYNPLDPGVIQRRLRSYYRNPSGKNRRRIEAMLQSTITAMKTTEEAISKSNDLVIELFKEFLEYTKEQDEVEEVEIPREEVEIPREEVEIPQEEVIDSESPESKLERIKQMIAYYGGYKQTATAVGDPDIPISTNTTLIFRTIRNGKLPRAEETMLKLDIMLDNWEADMRSREAGEVPVDIEEPIIEEPVTEIMEELPPPITELPNMRAVTAKILFDTANNPDTTFPFSYFGLPVTSKAKAKLRKIPEINQDLIAKDKIRRASDTIYECPVKKRYTRIAYATNLKGKQPARRGDPHWEKLFLDKSKDKKARKALVYIFQRICDAADGKIQDGRVFKRLRGDLWEFKSGRNHQIRIPCFMLGDTIYLTDIFKRNISDKVLDKAIDKSERIMREHIARRSLRRNPHRSSWKDHYDRIIDTEYDGAEEWLTPEEVDMVAQRAEEMAQLEREEADRDYDDEYLDHQFRGFRLPWYVTEPPPDDF